MTNNLFTNAVCAAVALFVTAISFGEVTSAHSFYFEYDAPTAPNNVA